MRRWGALRAVALAGAAVVLLSGCLKLDINLTVRSDDKVDGTFIVGVDKQVAALLPGGIANLDQLITNGEQPEINGAEDVKVPLRTKTTSSSASRSRSTERRSRRPAAAPRQPGRPLHQARRRPSTA